MSRRTETRLVMLTDCAALTREEVAPEVVTGRLPEEEELDEDEVMAPLVLLAVVERVDAIGMGRGGWRKKWISLRSDNQERRMTQAAVSLYSPSSLNIGEYTEYMCGEP